MKLLLASVFFLSCAIFPPPVPGTAQEQPIAQSSTQERDKRLAMILEKLSDKAAQYRENHTLLLKAMCMRSQYFKNDLTTSKGKSKGYCIESLVVRRPLPDKPSESGLVVFITMKDGTREAKEQDQKTAYTFSGELDFLLSKQQSDHRFSYGGQTDVEGRKVDVLNFVPAKPGVHKVINGGISTMTAPHKGRILVDSESYDVRQIDWTLIDKYETYPGADLTFEKWNSTVRFKKYDHPNLKREFWLPESAESLWVPRDKRQPALKATAHIDYKRFHTDVKVLDDAKIVSGKDGGAGPKNDRR